MMQLGPGPPHLPQVFLLLRGGSIKNFKVIEEKAKKVQILNIQKLNISISINMQLTHRKNAKNKITI